MVRIGCSVVLHKLYGVCIPPLWISDSPTTQLRHLQSKLSLRLRTRLTRYTHDLYLSAAPNLKYYRVSGEAGLEGIDQCVDHLISLGPAPERRRPFKFAPDTLPVTLRRFVNPFRRSSELPEIRALQASR